MSQRRVARRPRRHARLAACALLLGLVALLSACADEKWALQPDGTVTPVASSALAVPAPLAVNASSNRIYVARSLTADVLVIDGATNAIIATVALAGANE